MWHYVVQRRGTYLILIAMKTQNLTNSLLTNLMTHCCVIKFACGCFVKLNCSINTKEYKAVAVGSLVHNPELWPPTLLTPTQHPSKSTHSHNNTQFILCVLSTHTKNDWSHCFPDHFVTSSTIRRLLCWEFVILLPIWGWFVWWIWWNKT